MPSDDDGNGAPEHKGHLPPFTPPRFNWNQDNLYEQFKSFKRVVEFAFKRQYENCSNGIKCSLILNWLGVEAYLVYDNMPIGEDDKKNPTKLSDAFEHYFKPERNIFQSWYALRSICHASARPPAFLSTTPHIPSSLEGMRSCKALNGYHSLNIANDLGRNHDSRCQVCLSQSEAFPPLSL